MDVRLQDVSLALFAGRADPTNRSFDIDAFAGTGFVPAPGVFVTCWHCVSGITDGLDYAAAWIEPTGKVNLQVLEDIAPSPDGLDLATGRLPYETPYPFTFLPGEAWAGLDAWTSGYPLHHRQYLPDGRGKWDLVVRYLRGYIVREFENDTHPGFASQPTYELDMLTPAGLSGAPLFLHALGPVGLRLVGVVYGERESYTLARERELNPETGEKQEVHRLVSFGLAHTVTSLRQLRGPATQGRPLEELLSDAVG